MRGLFWLIALFGLAVGLALFAHYQNGYALLFMPPWRVELSLNAFVLLFAIIVFGGYTLLRWLDWIVAMPRNAQRFRLERRAKQARRSRRDALIAMFEGRYQKAERAARSARENEDDADLRLVDMLLGARAAHNSRDFDGRDRILEDARSATGDRSLAIDMAEAEMLYEQFRNREALAALHRVYSRSPKLTAALKLELKIRQQENHAARVIELADQLEKSDAIEHSQATRIRTQARLMQLGLEPMDFTALSRWWNGLSSEERAAPRLAAAAARAFARAGSVERAEAVLVDALEAEWDVVPLEAYGELGRLGKGGDPVKRLARAEDWLRHHPSDHHLLLALGRLCLDSALWGKARTYLEASIAVAATPIAHVELAQLLERLGEMQLSDAHYRASLGLALDLLEQRG